MVGGNLDANDSDRHTVDAAHLVRMVIFLFPCPEGSGILEMFG